MNWYNMYYNTEKKPPAGKEVSKALRNERATMSEKQKTFFSNLIEFLKGKGWGTERFEKPRNPKDFQNKCNGMKTIIAKNGWEDEFFATYYRKEG